MEFHYVVIYDDQTKKWSIENDINVGFPDGNVWDANRPYGWGFPEDGQESVIDERCHTMLRTLASIWPEVDHG